MSKFALSFRTAPHWGWCTNRIFRQFLGYRCSFSMKFSFHSFSWVHVCVRVFVDLGYFTVRHVPYSWYMYARAISHLSASVSNHPSSVSSILVLFLRGDFWSVVIISALFSVIILWYSGVNNSHRRWTFAGECITSTAKPRPCVVSDSTDREGEYPCIARFIPQRDAGRKQSPATNTSSFSTQGLRDVNTALCL